MRVIFYANTLFQVMTAIQLRRTVYREDEADLVVTDRTGEGMEFAGRIIKERIFRYVYFCNSKEFVFPKNLLKKTVNYLLGNVFPHSVLRQLDKIKGPYDVFLFHNDNIDCQVLYDRLAERNKPMRCIRFEEGYSAYIPLENTFTRGNKFRNRLGKKNLRELTEFMYLFHPELLLVTLPYQTIKMEKFNKDDRELRGIFNRIFEYHPKKPMEQKYVIFEEAFWSDREKVEDYEWIERVADLAGKENVLIKLHPRTETDRFRPLGIEVEKHKVPWEVMQMNEDMKGKVLISIASGSILASKLYFDEDVNSLLIYKCLKEKPVKVSAEFEQYIGRFRKLFDHNLYVPENMEELRTYFMKETKEVGTRNDNCGFEE